MTWGKNMGAAALQNKIEEAVGTIPVAPRLSAKLVANDNQQDRVAIIKRQARLVRAELNKWRSSMLVIVFKLDEILKGAGEDLKDPATRDHVNQTIALMLEKIDGSDFESDLADYSDKVNTQVALVLQKGKPEYRNRAQILAKVWSDLVEELRAMLADLRDRVKRLVWDYFPDARGGPKFDNSKDLLAFLNS
jgi:hypothetical protein